MKKLILLLILFVACDKKDTEFELLLINNKWVYYPNENINLHKARFVQYILFNEDGTCANYYILSEILNDSSTGKWEYLKEDNVLILFTHKFRILEIKKDRIIMQNLNDNSKVMLFKITNKVYDKNQGFI